jgi:DNA-directed RNA polymerase
MTLLTQLQVEEQMYAGGIKRANAAMDRNEQHGSADQNPYAKAIYREWVEPIKAELDLDLGENHHLPGSRKAHTRLLKGLEPESLAYLAVRQTLAFCLQSDDDSRHHRALSHVLGQIVHSELILTQFEDMEPELFHTLARDLGRRRSKNLRHKLAVYRNQATHHNIDLIEWPVGARDQVGMYLMGVLERVGFLEIGETTRVGYKHSYRKVDLALEVLQKVENIRGYVAITSPVYGPCVEPPRDWSTPYNGGFYTKELRRTLPNVVRCHPASRDVYGEGLVAPTFFKAVNSLQRTAWQVNTAVLDVIQALAAEGNMGEIVSVAELPKPEVPSWLTPDMKKADMSEVQLASFVSWKRAVTEWHTTTKLMRTQFGRFYAATRAAEMFRAYPAIYFVYFADSRGRLYPLTYGVNPQGTDMQKALLRFAKGKKLDTPEAVSWFHILGANKYGFDKASLAERVQWVIDRKEMLVAIGTDPVNNRDWLNADSPMQFLAWCIEYTQWLNDVDGFESHLPVGMDGSCNGLQHLSAMTRDPVGGAATNLLPAAVMSDIYRTVAEAAASRMAAFSYLGEGVDEVARKKEAIRLKWLQHGIVRSAVKRAVMTTPYGVTRKSATSYVISDYLETGAAPVFDKADYYLAAAVLMDFAWPAIGDVVVLGFKVMQWLKKSAATAARQCPDGVITWTTPSGFVASQAHFEDEVHRISTRLFGAEKIRVATESDEIDLSGHKAGLPPNFIHSLDAAHLHMTAAASHDAGIESLAMIHDDYGTHCADAPVMYHIIRDQFVKLYSQHDPLEDLRKKYHLTDPPSKGTLDINDVLESTFFFS